MRASSSGRSNGLAMSRRPRRIRDRGRGPLPRRALITMTGIALFARSARRRSTPSPGQHHVEQNEIDAPVGQPALHLGAPATTPSRGSRCRAVHGSSGDAARRRPRRGGCGLPPDRNRPPPAGSSRGLPCHERVGSSGFRILRGDGGRRQVRNARGSRGLGSRGPAPPLNALFTLIADRSTLWGDPAMRRGMWMGLGLSVLGLIAGAPIAHAADIAEPFPPDGLPGRGAGRHHRATSPRGKGMTASGGNPLPPAAPSAALPAAAGSGTHQRARRSELCRLRLRPRQAELLRLHPSARGGRSLRPAPPAFLSLTARAALTTGAPARGD